MYNPSTMEVTKMNIDSIVEGLGGKIVIEGIWKTLRKIKGLLGESTAETESVHDIARSISVFPMHRRTITEQIYETAFDSGKEVIYVTIMSKHTLMKMPELLLRARKSATTLKVLTWSPKVGAKVIRAFGMHLGEESSASDQIKGAHVTWKKLAKGHPDVIREARTYSSAPTMQGIVVTNDWALIELIPYRTKPEERPALFFSATEEPELFKRFQKSFRDLLNDAEAFD
jgi:hypothetical protein